MLATRYLTDDLQAWNQRWGAPFGYPNAEQLARLDELPLVQRCRLAGAFAFQSNNTTRTFEYPWVYSQLSHEHPLAIIDVGGGLAGLQFVLAKQGHHVYCVDPGLAAGTHYGWGSAQIDHHQLNSAFHTGVQAHGVRLEDAGFGTGTIDAVVCVSTIEHIDRDGARSLLRRAAELLRPGGRFIATIDLFLNLAPFTPRGENEWGTNIDVCDLISAAPELRLAVGIRDELYGFPEFQPQRIMERLDQYFIGEYPCLAQCLVLEKWSEESEPAS